jgi:GntR family transcriptional regulator, transcriptional repressor for pyruvate dehydrogenase complex
MPSGRASSIARGFETVRKVRRYEQVAEQIRRLISDGALKPGDLLPPERELVAKLGVGRSSIRDAVRTLEVMGILEPRQGHGTVVRDLSADALVVPLSLVLTRKRELVTELLDVRRMIEPGLAARAAKNATAEEIAHMAAILERHEAKLLRGEEAIDEDSDFHYAIALAARNSVVLRVLDVLMDLLRESRSRSLQVPGRPQRSFDGHRRILRALQKRDAKGAEAAVRRHLKEIEEVVMRQL